jgi:hypothetical protein
MKTRRYSVIFFRAIFVLIAAAAAYMVGKFHGRISAKAKTPSAQLSSSAPTVSVVEHAAPMVPDPKAFDQQRADGILEQWKSALKNPGQATSADFFSKLMSSIYPSDMPYLIDELAKLPETLDRDAVIHVLIVSLSHLDPDEALSRVSLIGNSSAQSDLTNEIFGTWLIGNSLQGLATLAKLPSGQQTQSTYLNAFRTWAGANPDFGTLAAAAAAALSAGPEQIAAMKGVAAGWVNNNAQAALAWAGTLPPDDSAVLQEAVKDASSSQPQLAAQYVDGIQDASARDAAIESISQAWATGHGNDPSGAMAWLDQVATGDTYDKSVTDIISQLVQKHPTKAASLTGTVTDPVLSAKLIPTVANTWGSKDPQAALTWLQSLPQSHARDVAVKKLKKETSDNTP